MCRKDKFLISNFTTYFTPPQSFISRFTRVRENSENSQFFIIEKRETKHREFFIENILTIDEKVESAWHDDEVFPYNLNNLWNLITFVWEPGNMCVWVEDENKFFTKLIFFWFTQRIRKESRWDYLWVEWEKWQKKGKRTKRSSSRRRKKVKKWSMRRTLLIKKSDNVKKNVVKVGKFRYEN